MPVSPKYAVRFPVLIARAVPMKWLVSVARRFLRSIARPPRVQSTAPQVPAPERPVPVTALGSMTLHAGPAFRILGTLMIPLGATVTIEPGAELVVMSPVGGEG